MTLRSTLLAAAALGLAAPAMAGNPGHGGPAYTPDLVPPVSNPGECYARVKVPAQYETITDTMVVKEAHTKPHVFQPKLQSRQEQVMVKEPSVRYQVRQPTYRTVSEQVLTRPSYDKLSVTPPSFSTVTETIQTSAPRLVWKKGNPGELARQGYVIHSTADGGAYGQGYSSTTHFGQSGGEKCGAMCEIWCLVEEPGETASVTKKVMTNPGGVRRTRVPAVYQTISKQVVADPGGVSEIPVPAEYRTITVEDVVEPGREALVEVPAEYGQVTRKQLVADERYEWRRVLCEPGTGTIAQPSYGTSSHSMSGHSTQSYSAPAYSAPAPAYQAPAPRTGYYGVDTYESGKLCRDDDCGGSGHSGGYGSYGSGPAYSSDYTSSYEGARTHRARRRH